MVAMTSPMLFIADLRDPDQMNGERAVGQATLSVSSNCCVFSHLDDTVIVGNSFTSNEYPHVINLQEELTDI